jgi:hypothetical protein
LGFVPQEEYVQLVLLTIISKLFGARLLDLTVAANLEGSFQCEHMYDLARLYLCPFSLSQPRTPAAHKSPC